jgi:hypothetical protein
MNLIKHKFLELISFFNSEFGIKKSKKKCKKTFVNNEDYNSYLKKRIIKRVERRLSSQDILKAIKILEGFIKHNPIDQEIHNYLGQLYFQVNDEIRAGKHFYFKTDKNEYETRCVLKFKESLGNDPILILKHLIYKENHKISSLNSNTKFELKILITDIQNRYSLIPKFAIGIKLHLDKI